MSDLLNRLRQKVVVGIVGGSDLVKQREQMGENVTNEVDYSFSGKVDQISSSKTHDDLVENGLVAYKDGELIAKQSIANHLGEDNIKELVNFVLKYIAELDIPIKR